MSKLIENVILRSSREPGLYSNGSCFAHVHCLHHSQPSEEARNSDLFIKLGRKVKLTEEDAEDSHPRSFARHGRLIAGPTFKVNSGRDNDAAQLVECSLRINPAIHDGEQ